MRVERLLDLSLQVIEIEISAYAIQPPERLGAGLYLVYLANLISIRPLALADQHQPVAHGDQRHVQPHIGMQLQIQLT